MMSCSTRHSHEEFQFVTEPFSPGWYKRYRRYSKGKSPYGGGTGRGTGWYWVVPACGRYHPVPPAVPPCSANSPSSTSCTTCTTQVMSGSEIETKAAIGLAYGPGPASVSCSLTSGTPVPSEALALYRRRSKIGAYICMKVESRGATAHQSSPVSDIQPEDGA